MTNPFLGIITQELKDTFNNAIDSLLEDEALTRPCKFVYGGTKYTDCSNCGFNGATGKSNGVYSGSGPIPFTQGICPYCRGNGKIEVEDSETIYLAIIFDYKKFLAANLGAESPDGYVQSISSKDLITKIKNVKYMIMNSDLETDTIHKFIIRGEPRPVGWGDDRYITCLWRRSGG